MLSLTEQSEVRESIQTIQKNPTMKRKTMTQQRMFYTTLAKVANVFATYKVDPHDEGAPIQDVVDHLIRCVGQQLIGDDARWFTNLAGLDKELWRFDHEAHAASIDAECEAFKQEMTGR